MPKRKLKSIIEDLHAELQESEDLSQADEESLRTLLDDIKRVVEEDEGPIESIGNDVSEAITRFEASHPWLTKTLRRVSELLRSAGLS